MSDPLRLVVVGGGSAGWIAASYINSIANKDRERVNISLIESPSIGRIGVGEATVPSIRETLSRIEFPEREFLRASEGTFKNAICFENWLHNKGETYFHPFDQREVSGRGDRTAQDWLRSARNIPWAETVSIMSHLCEAGRAPKALNWPDYGSVFPYAYHMDAEKFAEALATFSSERGVRHICATVEAVSRNEEGDIASVSLDSGETICGDLFLDCTGQSALLIKEALGVDYIDYSQWLLCDRAVAMRVPYDCHRPNSIPPYTMSRALSHGWAWDIPLQTRRGTGYVYSSQFVASEEAEQELRNLEGKHAKDLPVKHLQFRVGRRETFWERNCVAVGLSSGFIEPLESTALYTVEASIAALLDLIDFGIPFDPSRIETLRKAYNRSITQLYEEVLAFVNLHYCLTRRNDSAFWREVQKPERIVESLAEKLDLWRHKPPSQLDFDRPLQLFSLASFEYILFGMDYPPDGNGPEQIAPSVKFREQVRKSLEKMPLHEAWFAG